MSDNGNDAREMRDERRTMADRRHAERESVRVNPEVMGRTEPVQVQDRVPGESDVPRTEKTVTPTDHAMERSTERTEFWPPMGDFNRRLEDIQSEFINDPAAAVKKAERLVEEAVDHMARSMREHVKRMHDGLEGNADTERLRLMMRSYRAFIESMDGRRAA